MGSPFLRARQSPLTFTPGLGKTPHPFAFERNCLVAYERKPAYSLAMKSKQVQAPPMAETVSFRAEDGTTERAKALAEGFAELPDYAGIGFSRSRIYSMALARGLDALDEELKQKKRAKK
jgi:hypothetical protein